ncbi:hypothetical protein C8N35_1126 [Breoghania corrubedonensis]|uniref:Uncharacterized protein n=1 Tax=Breoghania corrubedonensis TaxID=665038 RepID=A0A2T5UVZ7_9HYPH|nr:hypothetical protein [Breoghania corrubedonensis]PTW55683.1 hypothetical protein C8N35_1126 [Breoghania corrubedonensis]
MRCGSTWRVALRREPIRQAPLPDSALAAKQTLDDTAPVTDCNRGVDAQFTWTYGRHARASGGIDGFLADHVALGMMWNNAQGAREVMPWR